MTDSKHQPEADGLREYLGYSAALRPVFPPNTDDKAAAAAVPPELFYAVLTIFNLSMINDCKHSSELMPSERFSISRARFLAKKGSSRRGIATDDKFEKALKKLAKLGYLTSTRKTPKQVTYSVTQKFEKALRDHATIAWSFMTKTSQDKLSAVPFVKLLQLNEQIFKAFFYSDFGDRWRAIRARINDRLTDLARASNVSEKRDRNRDHIHEDVNLWAVFNLLVVAREMPFLNISSAAEKLQLQGYVTNENDLQEAAERLKSIKYLNENANRILRFHEDVESEVSLLRKDIVAGLGAVRDACLAFLGAL